MWDPALACKHDYIQEVASHFPTLTDSQLGSTLAQIILQMQSSEEGQRMEGEEEGIEGKRSN